MRISFEEAECALFGRIVLSWSLVEGQLVQIALRLGHLQLHKIEFKNVRSHFAQLKERLEKGFATIPEISHLNEKAQISLARLVPIQDKRSIIAHGHYQGLTGADLYIFSIYRTRKGADWGSLQFHVFSQKDLNLLLSDIERAYNEFEELSRLTFLVPIPKNIKNK
jgi:hypothetical protein